MIAPSGDTHFSGVVDTLQGKRQTDDTSLLRSVLTSGVPSGLIRKRQDGEDTNVGSVGIKQLGR